MTHLVSHKYYNVWEGESVTQNPPVKPNAIKIQTITKNEINSQKKMFLRPSLGTCKYFSTSIKNTRSLRPSIKIGKESFQLRLDVQHFNKDEIRVKAHPEYVIIEGKQEKNTQQGYVLRQFIRKFKLPEGCIPSKMKCTIGANGWLTVEAKRTFKDPTAPVEAVVVPIEYGRLDEKDEIGSPKMEQEIIIRNPCACYPKIRPVEKK